MTNKQRVELRARILDFCAEPRTLDDIKERFHISGISAGAFLSGLRHKSNVEFDANTKTFLAQRQKGPR